MTRLNVGCGAYHLTGYANLDADPDVPADVHADALTYLSDCADGSLDEVYAGHFLEHLTPDEARRFLAECHRCLVPGGALAIVVPDMREVARRYVEGLRDAVYIGDRWWDVADLDAVCAVFLYSPIQETPHRWAWDVRTLARALAAAGFGDLREIDRYRDGRLGAAAWFQCGVEGTKGEMVD
jgi:SAM-dependent methyltransferase